MVRRPTSSVSDSVVRRPPIQQPSSASDAAMTAKDGERRSQIRSVRNAWHARQVPNARCPVRPKSGPVRRLAARRQAAQNGSAQKAEGLAASRVREWRAHTGRRRARAGTAVRAGAGAEAHRLGGQGRPRGHEAARAECAPIPREVASPSAPTTHVARWQGDWAVGWLGNLGDLGRTGQRALGSPELIPHRTPGPSGSRPALSYHHRFHCRILFLGFHFSQLLLLCRLPSHRQHFQLQSHRS